METTLNVLERLESTQHSGRLHIETPEGDGEVCMTQGQITTVRWGAWEGLPALLLLALSRALEHQVEVQT